MSGNLLAASSVVAAADLPFEEEEAVEDVLYRYGCNVLVELLHGFFSWLSVLRGEVPGRFGGARPCRLSSTLWQWASSSAWRSGWSCTGCCRCYSSSAPFSMESMEVQPAALALVE